jgi:hypothetical protein
MPVICSPHKLKATSALHSRVARFFGTKRGTKWPQNIPNGHKTYQMAVKETKWHKNNHYPKTLQSGMFGL